jgi:hypothetical protein
MHAASYGDSRTLVLARARARNRGQRDEFLVVENEAVPELALACAGVLSEVIRGRAARSGLHLWDGPVDPG